MPITNKIVAVYRERGDGDWDVVAAFDQQQSLGDELDGAQMAENIAQSLNLAGETVRLIEFNDWSDIVDVWDSGLEREQEVSNG